METTVVNIKIEKCDIKICRLPNNTIPDPPNLGCFGNPFHLGKYTREEAISKYKTYFDYRIEHDKEFKKAVLTLKGKKLGCFCRPEYACHGDIIKEYLDNYVEA